MARSLYYSIQFVTLHQKNPGYTLGNNAGNPLLEIGGVETSRRKYSIEVGTGDPGENPFHEGFDFSEWSVSFGTFIRPANFGAVATYATERGTQTYSIWGVTSVPDDFVLPAEFLDPSGTDYAKAAWDDFVDFALEAAAARRIPGAQMASVLNDKFGLYDTLSSHMNTQFDLIKAADEGRISPQDLLRLSDNASRALVIDLAGSAVGAPALASTVAKSVVARWVVAQNPADHDYEARLNSGGGAGFFPNNTVRELIVGSPTNDALHDGETSGDYVLGGVGNDTVYGNRGNDVLIGGGGVDEIDYGSSTGELNIDLAAGAVRETSGFTDVALGFENASGGQNNDFLYGTGGTNILVGNTGQDRLDGRDGNDSLEGGVGADTLIGGVGSDTAVYGYGIYDPIFMTYTGVRIALENPNLNTGQGMGDTFSSIENLHGSDGGDTLIGDTAGNSLTGWLGDDLLYGRGGHDTLDGGNGRDRLFGELGNDTYVLANGIDRVVDSGGADTITTTISRSLLSYVAIENLSLLGTAAISGTGNNSPNVIVGNAGANVLVGGLQRDILTGNGGKDVFYYRTVADSRGATHDIIRDFDDQGDDLINLASVSSAILGYRGTAAFNAANQVRVARSGDDVLILVNLDRNFSTNEMIIRAQDTVLVSMTKSDLIL